MTINADKYINPKLQELPSQLQERIFEKIFRVAEIAKMNKQEIAEYEDSLKKYRDLNSAVETAKMEGEMKREREIAQKLLIKGMSVEDVSDVTGLSEEQIKELIKKG